VQNKTLNVDDEYAALGDGIHDLIAGIKGKKPVTEIVSDVLPDLVAAVGGLANLGKDIKKVDNQVYLVKCIADALEPKVEEAPAA
jgi:hypothetical protein